MNDPLYPNAAETEGELELTHSDKAAGIFTEPSATFAAAAKFPPRTVDWLLPILLLILVAGLSPTIYRTNPEVRRQMIEQAVSQREKQLEESLKSGQITQEQAEQGIEQTRAFIENGGPFFTIMNFLIVAVFFTIIFFIVAGIYFLLSRFLLKGTGTYSSVLVASGLTSYIGIIQVIVIIILSLAFSKNFTGTSIAAITGMDKNTTLGFLLNKADIFTIWSLCITGIGLAKMFKSTDTKKYLIMIFSLWVIWSVLIFGLSKVSPFFSNFNV